MLLAADANQITVAILCIAALVFVLFDIYLVYSLHKHNKKLAKKNRSTADDAVPDLHSEENKDAPEADNKNNT